MSGFTRILVTSAIVPLVFPLILVLVGSVQYLFGLPGYRPFFVGAAWALFLTFPATIALGLPAHFTAQQRGATGLVGYVLGGGDYWGASVAIAATGLPIWVSIPKVCSLGDGSRSWFCVCLLADCDKPAGQNFR